MQDAALSRPPFWRRALRRAGILTSTALTGALAVGLVVVGAGYISARAAEVEPPAASSPMPVRVAAVEMQARYQVPVRHTGQIEPDRETALAFEAGGTVAEILVDEGDAVAEGDVIARLDTRALTAERQAQMALREALGAQLDLARLTEARQSRLAAGGATSVQRADEARLTVAELEARIRQIDAVLGGIDIALDKAVLRTPFDGRVGARMMDPGAQAAPGAAVLQLFEASAPRLRVGLPAAVAGALDSATSYDVIVGGARHKARFDRVRSDVDPVTRTVQALFVLEDAPALPYGTLADLSLTRTVEEPGAWVPVTALTEGERGIWSVLVVSNAGDGPIVAREAVEVLYADETRAFVRGPLGADRPVIVAGPHRVTLGQRVSVEG